MQLLKIYQQLLKKYGKQNWWPVSKVFKPAEFEICVGAILTQNTTWRNVEKALKNLKQANMLRAEDFARADIKKIEKLVKPSGFYKQKSRCLKEFCKFVLNYTGDFYSDIKRKELLSIKGIGKETADSILLYACNKPYFVVDVYTRRLFAKLGLIDAEDEYDKIRTFFEKNLPRYVELYKEFHALIVRAGKEEK